MYFFTHAPPPFFLINQSVMKYEDMATEGKIGEGQCVAVVKEEKGEPKVEAACKDDKKEEAEESEEMRILQRREKLRELRERMEELEKKVMEDVNGPELPPIFKDKNLCKFFETAATVAFFVFISCLGIVLTSIFILPERNFAQGGNQLCYMSRLPNNTASIISCPDLSLTFYANGTIPRDLNKNCELVCQLKIKERSVFRFSDSQLVPYSEIILDSAPNIHSYFEVMKGTDFFRIALREINVSIILFSLVGAMATVLLGAFYYEVSPEERKGKRRGIFTNIFFWFSLLLMISWHLHSTSDLKPVFSDFDPDTHIPCVFHNPKGIKRDTIAVCRKEGEIIHMNFTKMHSLSDNNYEMANKFKKCGSVCGAGVREEVFEFREFPRWPLHFLGANSFEINKMIISNERARQHAIHLGMLFVMIWCLAVLFMYALFKFTMMEDIRRELKVKTN